MVFTMTEIKICFDEKIIEITRAYAKKAEKYGSDEYKKLLEARKENPDYKVCIASVIKRKTSSYSAKGLDYDFIENYIKTHDNSEETLQEYYRRRGNKEKNNNALAHSESYGQIKKWFLEQYSELNEYYKAS